MNTKIAIITALIGAVILGVIITSFGNAEAEKERFTTDDKEVIREIVRDYISDNPEIIIEAINAYAANERAMEEARTKEAAAENLQALLSKEDGYVAGADVENASVAVIEFFDYHCGFCKRAAGQVQDLVKNDPQVKVVFRELPIIRSESEYPAKAALAAREQGKYTDLHFKLMNAGGILTEKRVHELAQEVGIDTKKLKADIASSEVIDSLDDTQRIAREMGIDGTPSFVIASVDGAYLEVIPGYSPEDIADAIKQAKAEAR